MAMTQFRRIEIGRNMGHGMHASKLYDFVLQLEAGDGMGMGGGTTGRVVERCVDQKCPQAGCLVERNGDTPREAETEFVEGSMEPDVKRLRLERREETAAE